MQKDICKLQVFTLFRIESLLKIFVLTKKKKNKHSSLLLKSPWPKQIDYLETKIGTFPITTQFHLNPKILLHFQIF